MIEIKNITQIYDQQTALNGINLSIADGEIVGIVGKSGSGKSTLLRIINLIEKQTGGTYLLEGEDTSTFTKKTLLQKKHQMGMVFQQFNLLNNLTVQENVALPLKLLGQKDEAKVQELLQFVGMKEKSSEYPARLSGGEKQRVAIARALVLDPQLLLCDEATSSLDEENTGEVLRLLQKIHQELRPTILFVSHELDSIKALCERVVVMEAGEIQGIFPNQPVLLKTEHTSYLERVERSLSR